MKYYTPSIEEFHVGFEYEIKLNNDNWEKCIFQPNKDNFSHRFKEETWFTIEGSSRVKYLDREDIESLGFYSEDNGECYNKSIGWMIIGIYPWEDVGGKPNEYKISVDANTNFHGTIKNKSELKRLLKQLNIT